MYKLVWFDTVGLTSWGLGLVLLTRLSSARLGLDRLGGRVLGDERKRIPKMLSLDGLEMIAVLVVMGLFIKVLEQFGMFEPVGGEGNRFCSN